MKSHDVNDHGASGQGSGQVKERWISPSLQVIALETAEGGTKLSQTDGVGAHSNRPRS
jgi:hypothetical protein